ncbi:MAG: hypothetical protein U0350_33140 [Caldilineaceae bacterium]
MNTLDSWRFAQLWRRLGGQGNADALFLALAAAYAEPQRAYHTTAHLQACLQQFDKVRNLAQAPDQVEMALWFHDAVYDPHAVDNEEQSAAWAVQALTRGGIEQVVAGRVVELILATKHQAIPETQDAKLLVDIDLAILGYRRDLFDEYARFIRAEYHWTPEPECRQRRSQILASFLARDTIYQTAYFYERYEQQARGNLVYAIAQLTSQ